MARFWEIDFLRGIAILMMIIFHFLWDLKYFGFIQTNLYSGFWGVFQICTAGLFLLLVGAMLALSAQKHKETYSKHFLIRGAKLFCVALLITLITWIVFPSNFIYFGIIHLIAVSIILSIPFATKKISALILGAGIIILPFFVITQKVGLTLLFWVGLDYPSPSFDFTPLLPWFGAVLIGISLGNLIYKEGKKKFNLNEPKNTLISKIQFLGKHSLLIYLLHQPIMFSLIWAITRLIF